MPLRKHCADTHLWTTWLRRRVPCCKTHHRSTRCWVISTVLTLPTYRSEQLFVFWYDTTHAFYMCTRIYMIIFFHFHCTSVKRQLCLHCCCIGAGIMGVPVWGGSGSALGAGLQSHATAAKLSGAMGSLAGQCGHSSAQALWAPAQLPPSGSTIPAQVVLLQVCKKSMSVSVQHRRRNKTLAYCGFFFLCVCVFVFLSVLWW